MGDYCTGSLKLLVLVIVLVYDKIKKIRKREYIFHKADYFLRLCLSQFCSAKIAFCEIIVIVDDVLCNFLTWQNIKLAILKFPSPQIFLKCH